MKTFVGTVTSIKMDKTAVVEVTTQWLHPVYRKTIKKAKKYLIHDEKNEVAVGDVVSFIPDRPRSKLKRFCLQAVVTKKV